MSSHAARPLAFAVLALALAFSLATCEMPSPSYVPEAESTPQWGSSSSTDYPCVPSPGAVGWISRAPGRATHVVDGTFTANEWVDATVLEGVLTDVYMDYREGQLYFLNDWRTNEEGIDPECFNHFELRTAGTSISLSVFGDGHVEVKRNGAPSLEAAKGAYGFGPSPRWSVPHTIYEFSLAIEAGQIDVCCYDPTSFSTCEVLAREPVVYSLHAAPAGASMEVARLVPPEVVRLPVGGACGRGQGVCVDGSRCVEYAGDSKCVAQLSQVTGLQAGEGDAESLFEPVDGIEPAPPF